MKIDEIINSIKGPVIPIPTPFKEHGEVDLNAIADYSGFLSDSGIATLMTTIGTSRYNLLNSNEIMLVNEAMVKGAQSHVKTIVASPITGYVNHSIEFAKHAENIGADFFLLYFPERHYGEENTYKFFEKVASAVSIKILIHEMPLKNGFGGPDEQYSLTLLNKLLEIDNIVGLKEESLDSAYSNKILSTLNNKAIIIGAGGGMSRYLERDYALGSKAFLGGIGGFIPELELKFYQAITSGNIELAKNIVNNIEKPYFDKVCPLGWHPSLKAALALKNLMPKYEREPMKVFSKAEETTMRDILVDNGWL